jgi:hypothetical protein
VDVVAAARAAMRERDWSALRPLLDPYLHWTASDGTVLRGRRNVLAMLETTASSATPPTGSPQALLIGSPEAPLTGSPDASSAEPADVELRDGQIYRWREHPSG